MHIDGTQDAGLFLSLTVPDTPEAGFTIVGTGFDPDSWIWITVDDLTDGTQPIDGPDAFQSDSDGTFTRSDQNVLACGHTVQANAFVQDEIVVTSAAVTPQCEPVPASTVPTNPLPFTKDTVFTVGDAPSDYWIYVPSAYDETHRTPITLFIWLHGKGGMSQYDISNVSVGGAQSYIAIAPGGREGGYWHLGVDPARVIAAIADVKTHFNINPRRVVLGGYSSGGDLAYRTAFYNSKMFAGVLAENTSPFMATGSTQAASLAAASWKFHVVHLAHLGDTTYPIATVRTETDAMKAAGFPIERSERDGGHYDHDTETSGTEYDVRKLLLPHLNDNWLAPE
jgi:predicted esterase